MRTVVLDTNVVVRYLVDGDLTLTELIKAHVGLDIPAVVWMEIVYVLEKLYKIPREMIGQRLQELLANEVVIAEKQVMSQTLLWYVQKTSLSVVDCYEAIYALHKNEELITFDVKLKRQSQRRN